MKKEFVLCTECEYSKEIKVFESDVVDRIECHLLPPVPFFACGKWNVRYPCVCSKDQGCFSGESKTKADESPCFLQNC